MTEIDTTEPLTLHQEMEVHETTSDEKVIQLEAEVAKLKDEWLRALAEVENVRRRAQKEKEEAARYGAVSFARDILSVTDNLRRALESCPQDGITDSMKALITGIEMTERELLSAFEKQGIKKLTPLNEKFNPHHHQAMFEVESTDIEPGYVVQVMQAGYMLYDRLLRPAYVGVSKLPQKKDLDSKENETDIEV